MVQTPTEGAIIVKIIPNKIGSVARFGSLLMKSTYTSEFTIYKV